MRKTGQLELFGDKVKFADKPIKPRHKLGKNLPAVSWFRRHFSYNPETGIVTSKYGNQVGFSMRLGYVAIGANYGGKKMTVSRSKLAFILMTGKIPKVIDHIDGNKTNDKWNNLRAVSYAENNANVVCRGYIGKAKIKTYQYWGVDWRRKQYRRKTFCSVFWLREACRTLDPVDINRRLAIPGLTPEQVKKRLDQMELPSTEEVAELLRQADKQMRPLLRHFSKQKKARTTEGTNGQACMTLEAPDQR